MTFIDHCQVPLGTGEYIIVFVILDGATTLLTAEAMTTTQEAENITVLRNYFDQYHLQPKSVLADQAFMTDTWEHFYQSLDITAISLGPNTPWPNRAEAADRLLKAQLKIMLSSIKAGTAPATLNNVTYRQLVKAAATVRNQTITYAGVTPCRNTNSASMSPDSPVDPPLPPHDKPGGGDAAKRQKQSISSSSGLNRLGGDVSLPSQSQSSQPILPTVVVPSPPAIITNPEAEDEDLEPPTLAQEETTGSPSKKQKTGKKKKKPDDNDESPGHSPRHDPASSSNYNPNNPANLPAQYESEEELIPHVPTSSGTGSSERTMRYTDQEDGDSEDSQRTRSYDDHQADLVLDEAHWSLMTAEQKICANTGSFTVPRDIEGNPVLLGRVKGTFIPSPRCGFSHQKYTDQNHVDQLCKNMTDDDRALLVLYSSKQESLKASSTSALIGKKRKEATATEIRAYQKQFLEAKQLECKSWLDNEVFDLVDTRKIQVRNWVTGRWVLTLKRDKDRNFLKTKARWVLRGFQDKQKNDQQTDSPAASRSGFRLAIQAASNKGWNIFHMDLKTAFLQGEAYDQSRDIICQIPAEIGYPPHIGARMKKPAYGLNDAPRTLWNILDSALRSYGLVPTRADRCTYVCYGKQLPKPALVSERSHPQLSISKEQLTTSRILFLVTMPRIDKFMEHCLFM